MPLCHFVAASPHCRAAPTRSFSLFAGRAGIRETALPPQPAHLRFGRASDLKNERHRSTGCGSTVPRATSTLGQVSIQLKDLDGLRWSWFYLRCLCRAQAMLRS